MLNFYEWLTDYDGPLHFLDRDFIAVPNIPGMGRVGFYKSTGRNSGFADAWFPCDGITIKAGVGFWVDKRRFANQQTRYGDNPALKEVGDTLAKMNIPVGKTADPIQINSLINTQQSIGNNESLLMVRDSVPDAWQKWMTKMYI